MEYVKKFANISELEEFLATPGIRIVDRHIDHNGIFHIFYEDDAMRLIYDKLRLERLRAIAILVEADEAYRKLKNNTQREIYLLHRYGVGGKDAEIISELLKPEMRGVLHDTVENVQVP